MRGDDDRDRILNALAESASLIGDQIARRRRRRQSTPPEWHRICRQAIDVLRDNGRYIDVSEIVHQQEKICW